MNSLVTQKQVQDNYQCVSVYYLEFPYLFSSDDADYYTRCRYGRNANIFTHHLSRYAVVSGERPFGKRIKDELVIEEIQKLDKEVSNYYPNDFAAYCAFRKKCRDKAFRIIQNYFDETFLHTINN